MNVLSKTEASALLANSRLQIGSWNQIEFAPNNPQFPGSSINCLAPGEAKNLLCLSAIVVEWINDGGSAYASISNSTGCVDGFQSAILARALGLAVNNNLFNNPDGFFLKFDLSNKLDSLGLTLFVNFFLLFEFHSQIASSTGDRILLVEDGRVYLKADPASLSKAKDITSTNINHDVLNYPQWVVDMTDWD